MNNKIGQQWYHKFCFYSLHSNNNNTTLFLRLFKVKPNATNKFSRDVDAKRRI